jgi:signal transduction histidine kinase
MFAVVGVAVLTMSFVVYFIFQTNYERQIRATIFGQEKQRHETYAKSVRDNIQSDLGGLMTRLEFMSQSKIIQDGELTGARADAFLDQVNEDASQFAKIDGLTLLDASNLIVNYNSPTLEQGRYIGVDASETPAVAQFLENQRKPTFTNGYVSPFDASYRIALVHPINDFETGEYMGAVAIGVVLDTFLGHYANIDDANSLHLTIYDESHTVLSSPFKDSIGKNFFDPKLQQNSSSARNEHFGRVFSGQSNIALTSFMTGERLNAGEPIILDGRPEYYVFVATPTASIYAQIDSVISSQRTGFYLLEGGIAVAVGIASFLLTRSWTLERAVKKRTGELQLANNRLVAITEELRSTNLKLKKHDQLQSEFINVAAHELRTPMMPIVAIADEMEAQVKNEAKTEVMVRASWARILSRNAKRLEQLAQDILDVTRIDSNSLNLKKEELGIGEIIDAIVQDFAGQSNEKGLIVQYRRPTNDILIPADRGRITQVLVNLLINAIKFSQTGGAITISLEEIQAKNENLKEALVSFKDNGSGIDPEIMPNLFSKFISKSENGIGLGLYISKAIVQAHGGKIWAENNKEGGATFSFTLPCQKSIQLSQTAYPHIDEGEY